jgi:hypothetical protein
MYGASFIPENASPSIPEGCFQNVLRMEISCALRLNIPDVDPGQLGEAMEAIF